MGASRLAACVLGCAALQAGAQPTFTIADAELGARPVFIAYGDIRFTAEQETVASQPRARRALIAKIALERPAALFINGDLPWRGVAADYGVFRAETAPWRAANLRVYPALGNHEFAACAEAQCLERWWSEFPQLRARRWYSVAVGRRVLAAVLDSDASLADGSEQRQWLERQIDEMAPEVRFVVLVLHHPPVADLQRGEFANHNPRSNELALAGWLDRAAPRSRARFVVSAGHMHNYERRESGGVMYLVSGGGGAQPYPVERTAGDLYRGTDFPNFHYVRFELQDDRLVAEMIRLSDYAADAPSHWETRDRFVLKQPP
jgi:hypothetical protein